MNAQPLHFPYIISLPLPAKDALRNFTCPVDKKSRQALNKPEMVNAPEGLNKVILRKIKRFDCKTNQVSSKQLASS